jgi:hypothetical protein
MRSKDFERQNENLEYYYDEEEDPDKVELQVKNIGSLSAHILYIIELGDEILEHSTDFFINPGNIKNVEELLDNLTISINENNSIQLVSERGKVYQTIYEPEKDRPITRKVLNDYLEALTHTFGDYIVHYHSWEWAEVNPSNEYVEGDWSNTWFLPNKTDLVFRINVTYYGELEPMIINHSSVLNFYESQSSAVLIAYIVSNAGEYNNEHLEKYDLGDPLKFWWGENVTFYFGADKIGGAPNGIKFSPSGGHNNIYTGVMVIDDPYREYAQSFPLIGVKIV